MVLILLSPILSTIYLILGIGGFIHGYISFIIFIFILILNIKFINSVQGWFAEKDIFMQRPIISSNGFQYYAIYGSIVSFGLLLWALYILVIRIFQYFSIDISIWIFVIPCVIFLFLIYKANSMRKPENVFETKKLVGLISDSLKNHNHLTKKQVRECLESAGMQFAQIYARNRESHIYSEFARTLPNEVNGKTVEEISLNYVLQLFSSYYLLDNDDKDLFVNGEEIRKTEIIIKQEFFDNFLVTMPELKILKIR